MIVLSTSDLLNTKSEKKTKLKRIVAILLIMLIVLVLLNLKKDENVVHISLDIINKGIKSEKEIREVMEEEKEISLLNMNDKEIVVDVAKDSFNVTLKDDNEITANLDDSELCEDDDQCKSNSCYISKCRDKGYIAPNLNTIDNVYFINLDESKDRRYFMESWLNESGTRYQRIPASQRPLSNETYDVRCVEGKQNPYRCRGMKGLRDSNINIMDNYNVSGMTMVLEDDVAVDIPAVLTLLHLVPSNWDVLRLDCKCRGYDNMQKYLKPERYINNVTWDTKGRGFCRHGTIFQTTLPCDKDLKYCGGTHAVIWRSDRLHKLREFWGRDPVNDIDCTLITHELHSYCVQGSVVKKQRFKISTIPKFGNKMKKNVENRSYSYREHFIDSIQFREASLQDEIFQNKEDEKRVFMIMQLLRELKNLKEKVPNDLNKAEYATLINEQHEIYNKTFFS